MCVKKKTSAEEIRREPALKKGEPHPKEKGCFPCFPLRRGESKTSGEKKRTRCRVKHQRKKKKRGNLLSTKKKKSRKGEGEYEAFP